MKHQEWSAALQIEHCKTAAKLQSELDATAADLEVKAATQASEGEEVSEAFVLEHCQSDRLQHPWLSTAGSQM